MSSYWLAAGAIVIVGAVILWSLRAWSSVPSSLTGAASGHLLLAIAHPDDESMFFVPTVRAFIAAGWRVSIACLSNGSGGGIASVRTAELVRAAGVLGVATGDVSVYDIPQLRDSMTAKWEPHAVRGLVATAVAEKEIDMVVTFDESGISGHLNHIGVHEGTLLYSRQSNAKPCYKLLTVPVYRKFTSVFDVIPSLVGHVLSGGGVSTGSAFPERMFITNSSPALSDAAMQAHKSQYLWFRKLFVYFSRYAFLNTLQRMR